MNIKHRLKRLLDRMLLALNPTKYDLLAKTRKRDATKYFLGMCALVFAITLLLMIPNLFSVPGTIGEEFSKFERLKVDLDYHQAEPINLPEHNPVLTIDTTPAREKDYPGFFLITDQSFYYRPTTMFSGKRVPLGEEESSGIGNIMISLLILSAPTLIALTFIYSIIKYGILILFTSFFAFVFARVIRFGVSLRQTTIIAIFATTPMVLLAMLTKPFVPSLGYLEYAVFFIYFFLGCVKVGEFEEVHKPSERQRHNDHRVH